MRLVQSMKANLNRRVVLVPQRQMNQTEMIKRVDQANQSNQMEIVLTRENDQNTPFRATTITAIARNSDGQSLSQSMSGTNCSALSYVNWPPHTDHFDVNITVPRIDDVVDLYAFGWYAEQRES